MEVIGILRCAVLPASGRGNNGTETGVMGFTEDYLDRNKKEQDRGSTGPRGEKPWKERVQWWERGEDGESVRGQRCQGVCNGVRGEGSKEGEG